MTDSELDVALKKYSVGDSLSDVELNGLAMFFKRVYADLFKLTLHFDAGFGLAKKEALSNIHRLESYQLARAGK